MSTFDKDELEVEAELSEEYFDDSTSELEIEETYVAYLDDLDEPDLLPREEERRVLWDDDDYEYYDQDDSATVPEWDDLD